MEKRFYAEEVAKAVNGQVKEVTKNGVPKIGIMLPTGTKVSPVVYIDEYYENGRTIEEAIDMVRGFEGSCPAGYDEEIFDVIYDYEKVKDKIRVRLYNKEVGGDIKTTANKYGFPDLILVPYVEGIVENGSIKVTKELLEKWGITKEKLIRDGIKNLNYKLMGMSEMLFGVKEKNPKIWVVTNKEKYCGAASIIAAKKELAKRFPDGYIVLPSSIHEVLIVSKNICEDVDSNISEISELLNMVKEINATVVSPEDKLSDNIYEMTA